MSEVRLDQPVPVAALRDLLGMDETLVGDCNDRSFDRPGSPERSGETSVLWISPANLRAAELIRHTEAAVYICAKDAEIPEELLGSCCIAFVANPRLFFIRVLSKYFKPVVPRVIHADAFVHPEAELAPDVSVAVGAVIGKAKIGAGTIIGTGVIINDGVEIGREVEVDDGAILGAVGVGYEKNPDGQWEEFPQLGGLVVEDFVKIGPRSIVARGALGPTILRKGVKIGGAVQVGHNVVVGENSILIANVVVCGSVKIGEDVWVSPGVIIKEKVTIGNRTTIGIGGLVIDDVPDGATVVARPAILMPESTWNK